MKKRELHNHTITHPENRLRVYALGERSANGDNHLYLVEGCTGENHPQFDTLSSWAEGLPDGQEDSSTVLMFQSGDPSEGYNGVTIEALLAICYDRLNGCQAGPFASEFNAQAMIHITAAMEQLHDRTRAKLAEAEEATDAE